ncbi:hypothetical protein [Ramlibacter sp.]|uniref:hypothetical protein n=1 Tax=Ramlibacter sp. TaxID=1917967 RepID=UPI003D0CB0F1
MLHPLVSLWRPTCRVTFYDRGIGAAFGGGDWMDEALPPLSVKRSFRTSDEAVGYLRYWIADPSASAELRWLLKKSSPAPLAGATAERWMHSLASLIQQGVVMVVEESARKARPARLSPAPAAGAAAAAAALSALPPLASVPAVVVAAPLLPLVEDVRIEGAEVLPEIEQSLAQVQATIDQIDAAAANVEPAPNKVPDITTAMQAAVAKAQQSIDDA